MQQASRCRREDAGVWRLRGHRVVRVEWIGSDALNVVIAA
jgi:hypothetical protein